MATKPMRSTTVPDAAVHMRATADLLLRAAKKIDAEPGAQNGKAEALAWKSFGEFLIKAALACRDVRVVDSRLVRAPTGAGEIDPSGGGFLVPEQFLPELLGMIYEQAVLAPLCHRYETVAPLGGIKIPAIDETSRQDGSRMGGTVGYWLGEGASISASLPKSRLLAFDPKKFAAVVVCSSELFMDAGLLAAYVKRAFAAEFSFQLDLSIFSGNGAGKPLGVLNSPCLITVAKEIGQASATVVAENVRKMWSRLPAPSRRRAIWIIGEDLEEQLEAMSVTVGTGGAPAPTANALYMPAGAAGNEFPLLKGRPCVTIEQAAVVGTPGDIVLADLSHFLLMDAGMKIALSLDVDFVSDQALWRFTTRVDGQSEFASAITPYNGSGVTRSPFVALAAR